MTPFSFFRFDWKDLIMGMQYLFVASGATILVPILTGIPVSACLFAAGIGTLLFHAITKGKVPVLLSSSFAFIAPVITVSEMYGLPYAFGGIVAAGLLYLPLAGIIYVAGIEKVLRFFPAVITSTMVILIGLILAPVAINNASTHWPVAILTLITCVVIKGFFEKNLFGSLSVIIAIITGTIISIPFGLLDISAASSSGFIELPVFTIPRFSFAAISIIAPVAIVTFLEHFADISAVSKVVEEDFLKDPGIHRTLMGDGVATAISGLFGGCPNTTYSENIGALEMTGVKKPGTLRITAVLLFLLAFFPTFAYLIHAIPKAVVGGISILLFGMIASSGIKGLVSDKVNFKDFKNMIIVATMLIIGVGGTVIDIFGIQFSSLAIAAVTGIILNLFFDLNDWVKRIYCQVHSQEVVSSCDDKG
ncbi:uracil-xanthine permease family protein [Candidatus Contubernalis alkaliaceticus]|uniref:uracil-xanthine permease family protein n=1 Tax=Candidatus Contubernalis alkaliaceticus TaxID=338645 RepID=UPI001F4C2003|nr:solute carrier family 23 protein [Candidatus Contubernalis alkalaceticus]UNC92332.1 uracil permease [Candidatus Contubernalis alkalaceticus]